MQAVSRTRVRVFCGSAFGVWLVVACNTPRVVIRRQAEQGDVSGALRAYTQHVRERGAPNPDALASVAAVILRNAARSDDVHIRNAAFSALRGIGVRGQDVLSTLERVPGAVGDRATAALYDAEGHEGAPPARLILAVRSGDPERVIAGLVVLDVQNDVETLLALLPAESSDVRRAVAGRLRRFRAHPEATTALVDHLAGDPDGLVRAACASALGAHGEPAGEALEHALDDPEMTVRMNATSALVQASLGRADRVLSSRFESSHLPDAQTLEAARAMAMRGVSVAAAYVLHALDDAQPAVRAQAAVAATGLGEMFLPQVLPYLESADPEVRLRIGALLVHRDAYRERVIRAMRPLAANVDPMVAIRALSVLAEARDVTAVASIREALRAPDVLVRRMAVSAWSHLATDSGEVDPLVPLLQDADLSVQLSAAAEVIYLATR